MVSGPSTEDYKRTMGVHSPLPYEMPKSLSPVSPVSDPCSRVGPLLCCSAVAAARQDKWATIRLSLYRAWGSGFLSSVPFRLAKSSFKIKPCAQRYQTVEDN